MKRYPRTLTFFAGSIFLTLFGAISTISAQQRVPADFIEQQRNNAKKEIADLRTTQDINLLKAFIINWQNQDNVKSRIVAAYIEEIQKNFTPFIELFNQEAGQQIILSQHAQELADSLAHDQGRLFTQKLAQLIKEHGISLLFTALLVDENNVHLRTFFDTAIQENAIFTALPGQAEQEIAVFHLVAHLVKHQQRRLDDDSQEDYSYFEPIARVIERGRADLVSLLLHSGLLRFFLEKEDHNVLVKMLNVALVRQQPEIVALLLQEPGIDCNNARILARLRVLNRLGTPADIHIYRFNQEEIIDINTEVPLILALKYYTHPQGQRCLDALFACHDILINQEDFNGESKFWLTLTKDKNLALHSFLQNSRADQALSFESDNDLFFYASSQDNLYNVQILLEFYRKKAHLVSKKTNQPTSLLMSTILNKKNSEGNTPLMAAVKEGHLDCVALLLSQPEIAINEINNNGETALIIAAQNIAQAQNDAQERQLQDQETPAEFHKQLKKYEYIIDAIIGLQKECDLFLKDNHENNFLHYLEGNHYLYKKYVSLFLTHEEYEIVMLIDQAKKSDVASFIKIFELGQAENPLFEQLYEKGIIKNKYENLFDSASSSREAFNEELLFSSLITEKNELLAFVLHKCGFVDKICKNQDSKGKTVLSRLIELAIRLESISCIKVIFDHVKESFAHSEIKKITNCLLYAAQQNKPAVMNYIFDYFEEEKFHRGVIQLFKNSLQRDLSGDSLLPYLNDNQLDKIFEMTKRGVFQNENHVNVSVYDITGRAVYETALARVTEGDTDYLKKFLIFSYNGDLFDYTDQTGYRYQKNDLFYDLVLAAAKTGQIDLLTEVLRLLPRSYSINYNKKGIPLLIQFFEYIHAQVAQGAHVEQWLPVVRTLLRIPDINLHNGLNISLHILKEDVEPEIFLLLPALIKQAVLMYPNRYNFFSYEEVNRINEISPLLWIIIVPHQNELFREVVHTLPASTLNRSVGEKFNHATLSIVAVNIVNMRSFSEHKEEALARLQILLDLPGIDINKRITLNDGRVVTALSLAQDEECRALLLRYGAQE